MELEPTTEIRKTSVDSHLLTIQEFEAGADESADSIRSAEITFDDGEFQDCTYNLGCTRIYSFEDWLFLGRIANEITKLQKKFDSAKPKK